MSQADVADGLGTSRPNVSRIENEVDVRLSTLERYVEALGGRFEIRAVFDDEAVKLGLTLAPAVSPRHQPSLDLLPHEAPRPPDPVSRQHPPTREVVHRRGRKPQPLGHLGVGQHVGAGQRLGLEGGSMAATNGRRDGWSRRCVECRSVCLSSLAEVGLRMVETLIAFADSGRFRLIPTRCSTLCSSRRPRCAVYFGSARRVRDQRGIRPAPLA